MLTVVQPFWLAGGELTNSEQVTLRQSVEHKISKLMLKDCHAEKKHVGDQGTLESKIKVMLEEILHHLEWLKPYK